MRRWLLLLLVLVPLSGCGIQPTGLIYAGDPAVARQAVPQTIIYFVRAKRLYEVQRPSVPGAPQAAIDQLVTGPTKQEYAAGIGSSLPPAQVIIRVEYGEADIYYAKPTPRLSPLAEAQLVCTAGAQPDVHKVRLMWSDRVVDSCNAAYPEFKPVAPIS